MILTAPILVSKLRLSVLTLGELSTNVTLESHGSRGAATKVTTIAAVNKMTTNPITTTISGSLCIGRNGAEVFEL